MSSPSVPAKATPERISTRNRRAPAVIMTDAQGKLHEVRGGVWTQLGGAATRAAAGGGGRAGKRGMGEKADDSSSDGAPVRRPQKRMRIDMGGGEDDDPNAPLERLWEVPAVAMALHVLKRTLRLSSGFRRAPLRGARGAWRGA